ncbi:MAG TPA: ABC transporter substrate-binding protein, partial [Methanomassiliicoccales archaeon]|nr:ABC transporter substrate-binding protein [Methanomassiliicoccales archaeon]
MANKLVIGLVALIVISAGVMGALVVMTPAPEDNTIRAAILHPADGSTVTGVLNVTANITSKKTVTYAALKLDGALVGNLTAAPFYWDINTPEIVEGQHILNLTAGNSAGMRGQSQITITINNGGTTAAIQSPTNASHVNATHAIDVDVVSPRAMKYVSIAVDGAEVANLTSAPYSYSWNTSSEINGEHHLTAKAVDILNMTGRASVDVIVDNPFSYVDARGVTINFPKIPQRVVTLGNSFTEVVFAVGADSQLVGRDDKSTYPSDALSIPVVGNTYGTKDALIAAQPDLIIAWKYSATSTVLTDIAALGYKVVAMNPTSIPAVEQEMLDIGNLTGHYIGAKVLVDGMKQRIAQVEAKLPQIPLSQRPTVYFELRGGIPGSSPAGGSTVNNLTMSGQIIQLAGGFNVFGNASARNPSYIPEQVIARMPQIIVIENQSLVQNSDIENRSGWSIIPAVVNHQIFRINGEWMTASPRLVN